jgi:hypothetical protein
MAIFNPADFSQLFRTEAYAGVEYSFDATAGRFGVMVGGKQGFLRAVEWLASGLPFAADWAWTVQRFTALVNPDAFLLRVDCQRETITALTLYSRFPAEPDCATFRRYMQAARPFEWRGPEPGAVAAVLGVPGPRGIAFRVNTRMEPQTAVYYRVPAETVDLSSTVLPRLVEVCGLPETLSGRIGADIHALYPRGPVGVVGMDSGQGGCTPALKFNPANVPLSKAISFLSAKQAPAEMIAKISEVANSLRAQWMSYLGAKYNAEGFAGWRAYFSVRPDMLNAPLLPAIVLERSAVPTFHLPHY